LLFLPCIFGRVSGDGLKSVGGIGKMEDNHKFWIASVDNPIYLYYCKANIQTGNTVVVVQGNEKHTCRGVSFTGLCGSFEHQNSGDVKHAKRQGARNVLKINLGRVDLIC
jgi:hypothetical protein